MWKKVISGIELASLMQTRLRHTIPFLFILLLFSLDSCKNREVTPEDLEIRDIHTSYPDKFDTIYLYGINSIYLYGIELPG